MYGVVLIQRLPKTGALNDLNFVDEETDVFLFWICLFSPAKVEPRSKGVS